MNKREVGPEIPRVSQTHSESCLRSGPAAVLHVLPEGSGPGGSITETHTQPRDTMPSGLYSVQGPRRKAEWLLGASAEGRSYTLPANSNLIGYTKLRKFLVLQTFDKQLVGSILAQVKV